MFWPENLTGRDLGLDGTMILKWIMTGGRIYRLVEDGDQWWILMDTAMNFWVL
jgi:hypothetical protein